MPAQRGRVFLHKQSHLRLIAPMTTCPSRELDLLDFEATRVVIGYPVPHVPAVSAFEVWPGTSS